MAKWINLSEQQKKVWDDRILASSQVVKDIVSKYNLRPDEVYRICLHNDRCIIHTLHENGRLTVSIIAEHNRDNNIFLFDRCVFDVDPAHLVEADYPFVVKEVVEYQGCDFS
jgi:hypothetical protein